MKKLFFISGLILACISTRAQVATLVKSYNAPVLADNTGGEGYKYWQYDNGQVIIYNTDHTLYKKVAINGAPKNISGYPYISTNVFNTDSKVEFMFSILGTGGNTGYIYNEDGQELQRFENMLVYEVKNIDNKATLIISKYNGGGTDIYHLQGKYTGLKPEAKEQGQTGIYPNPVDNAATITYTLPDGVHTGTLSIYAVNGVLVKQMTVTDQFNDVLIQRGDMAPGSYYYQVHAPGIQPLKQSFIVR
ncbi:MAG: T9SS type A sorting domain-containing protein [Sphingobacteriales bacterium]|nr:MAG: T9SS type A sorting domain-containing protein [Sphingobacteriales bacterium]